MKEEKAYWFVYLLIFLRGRRTGQIPLSVDLRQHPSRAPWLSNP
jgi:hypothetical protein